MMLRTKDGKTTAIDFREMAPSQASRDMFLDDRGNPDSKIPDLARPPARRAPLRASLALEKYGTMPLNKVVQPAIKLAREGFVVNDARQTTSKPTVAKSFRITKTVRRSSGKTVNR